MKKFHLIAVSLLLPAAAAAQNLVGTGASVHDSAGTLRETFTSGETITLRQGVNVLATDTSSVQFKFEILNPAGTVVFTHTGNAAPGTAGGAQSQLAGISVNSFYSSPGDYTFRGTATQTPYTPVVQTTSFLISSPNITLIYPPYGARGLSDDPLTFRWTASGASKSRVTVADNAGLYNELHSAVNSGTNYYSYPQNPTRPREQLVPDQVYYWKVEGLDGSNNKISESNVYNFSLKGQASAQTRNVAVTRLDLSSPMSYTNPVSFRVTLSNTGSATESNISVKFSLGGVASQDSPKQVASIGPSEQTDLTFTAFMPAGQDQALAVACADLFDDNMPDNCKTRLLAPDATTSAPAGPGRKLSYDEMFQAILQRLGPDAAKALEGYTFESLSCPDCTQDELTQVVAALISGDAQLVSASVTDTGGPAEAATTDAAAAAASETQDSESLELAEEPSIDMSSLAEKVPGEWSGYTDFRGKQASTFVIRGVKEWRKLWNSLSEEAVPDLDFASSMVVGVISGSEDRAAAVRLLGSRKTDDGIAFDYYQIEAARGAEVPTAAYIFRVFKRSDEKASFARLDVKR